MSVVEYRVLLYQFSEEIDWRTQRRKLIFILRAYLPDGSQGNISDIDSLLTMLEEKSILGIDRLNVMKELLKEIGKWDLLRRIERFEIKRKDYKQLLEKISHALDDSNELQRLISICRGKNLIARESEDDIVDVNALLTVLEQRNNLGIEDLTLLKTLANEMEKPDLCRLLEEFEKKRKQEEDAERERREREDNIRKARAQAARVLSDGINIGGRLVGVVTPHCTFRNVTGAAVIVTTWIILRRSPNMEAFVNAFKEAVLPFGNCLRAISEGSMRFALQAENISSLDALWESYKNETLQKNLQEFLVTEEIKQLAGGEVTLTVHIDEDEYRNAMLDLMISGKEGDRLEKLDRVEGFFNDAIVNWNSFQEAYKDAYPSEGRALHSIEEEFKRIRITLGILRETEKEWIDAEPIMTSSSSAQAVIQQLENFLQLDQGFFKNPTIEGKRAIRYLARKATNFKRFDVFDYLRKITPPGTTGPRLPDNLLIKEMPEDRKKSFSKCFKLILDQFTERQLLIRVLGLRSSDMNYLGSTSFIDDIARRHDLRTVGELYDFLCEKGLPPAADIL